jgi:hypothetical protein
MAQVQAIFPIVWTSDSSDAGTDGDVYLGFGGREFRLDSPRDDFRRGYPINLAVGAISQVSNPTMNDPRGPYIMLSEHVDLFPVYLRLEGNDHWKVAMAFVVAYSGADSSTMQPTNHYYADLPPYGDGKGGLWLGPEGGQMPLHASHPAARREKPAENS